MNPKLKTALFLLVAVFVGVMSYQLFSGSGKVDVEFEIHKEPSVGD